jgi:hypothetical protein
MRQAPTEEQVIGWFDELSNWGRWGTDDMLGTLNLITPHKRVEGLRLATDGITISCALPISDQPAVDDRHPARQFMISGVDPPGPGTYGRTSVTDYFTFSPHGITLTHLDAPAHSLWRSHPSQPRTLFNGTGESQVTSRGALSGGVELAADGIVTRGVLLDLPGLFGVEWLTPGTPVFPEDLEAAETRQGVRVRAGDALLIRLGQGALRTKHGPFDPPRQRAGLQAACLPWLRERDVALLVPESGADVSPSGYPNLGLPIHGVGQVAIGLWLLDNTDLDSLTAACIRLERWTFAFVVAALKWPRATGTLVNPLALL